MKFLENLKTIFESKFSDFNDLLSNNKVVFFDFSRNTTNTLELKEGDRLSIDVDKCSDEERKLLKEKIIDVIVQNDKDVFLMDHSSEKTKKIKKNLPSSDDELLKFYKDKLKPEMYRALEGSLVVRNAANNWEDILELKRDIARKYPSFGNNLCNLVTEGYFDDHFRELYHSMLKEEYFDIRNYQKKVEDIVISLPYTVFVTRFKSYDELSGEVYFKLERLKKYGAGKLILHGLGRENIDTTLNILEEFKDDQTITIDKEVNPKKTIVTAILNF